ncbi:hypothetical protein [Prescottella agglutinans]|uniref:hypothetical protein n=1 Tax=Prescottella agglutinans TaxID=1644129 RepID=UPI003D98DC57
MGADFGVTAWGRTWLRTIESTATSAPNLALPQARTLARRGSVTITSVGGGAIRAEVLARGRTFPVAIDVPLWGRGEAVVVRKILGRVGARDRRILAGDIPDTVVADLKDNGISVAVEIPECVVTCGCTSRRRPCVHHLSVVYCLAQRIDEEPALAVALRERRVSRAHSSRSGDTRRILLTEVDATSYYGD